ncbi:hypothetical protein JRO89_XS03G0261600 [Xanthoceras sorbifolium]|uniref:Uncharacterized protein n=1 Tax=Xanthoceras sorbifolium TaxID=99658 RepID=A0ABQ8IBY8_9ROSI|nr:hypothetical protein JRO89_XS03G0261600 [Xanthoceras sorbifolium]
MSFWSSLSTPPQHVSVSLFSKSKPVNVSVSSRFRASSAADVPDFLSADWLESRRKRPFGPRLNFSAEEAVQHQLDALKYNDQPRQDYGIEVMYRFAGFDPFERSTYFGPFFDLGQFERFRRIFHHSTYRVLLGHKERKILSSLFVKEVCNLLTVEDIDIVYPTNCNIFASMCYITGQESRIDLSSGFGFEEVVQMKKKYFNLPWFRCD